MFYLDVTKIPVYSIRKKLVKVNLCFDQFFVPILTAINIIKPPNISLNPGI
jgi:hypothetical protein